MHYETFKPGEALSAVVKCYWVLEGPAEQSPQKQRIIPDGCMEMIFHYGDLYKQYMENGEAALQPRCCVFGQLTTPLEIEATGTTGMFSVRFHPDGFMPFATLPIKAFENKAMALGEVFGEDGLLLAGQIVNAGTVEERINIVELFLLQKLANAETIDRIIKSTIQTIVNSHGQLSVDELSEKINVHRRQLERKFSSGIGVSPKQLSKIIRIQSALKILLNNQFTSLTDLAYEADYYDQAHFIRDFKEFTGLTPKEFYRDNLKISTLFYGKD